MRIVPPPRDVNLIGVTWREWWVPTPRGWAVLATGLWCIFRGLSYLDPLANIVPLTAYERELPADFEPVLRWASIVLWCTVGALCIGNLLRRRWRAGMAAAAAIHMVWALGALTTWVFLGEPRAWFTAARDLWGVVLIAVVAIMLDPLRTARRSRR